MRGSCLTQNGAWFKSQKQRGSRRVRQRELHRSQRTHLSSPSLGYFFCSPTLFLLSLLFSLQGHCCPFFLHIFSAPLLSAPTTVSSSLLLAPFWSNLDSDAARIQGGDASKDSRRDSARRGFNESEASSAGEKGLGRRRVKYMLMICTHQKGDPG